MSNLPREREKKLLPWAGLGCTDRDPHVDVRRRRRRRLVFPVFGLRMRKGGDEQRDVVTMDGYDDTEWRTPCGMEILSESCRHDREFELCPGL